MESQHNINNNEAKIIDVILTMTNDRDLYLSRFSSSAIRLLHAAIVKYTKVLNNKEISFCIFEVLSNWEMWEIE